MDQKLIDENEHESVEPGGQADPWITNSQKILIVISGLITTGIFVFIFFDPGSFFYYQKIINRPSFPVMIIIFLGIIARIYQQNKAKNK